jgi:histidinol-phosphate phosphatase family protein
MSAEGRRAVFLDRDGTVSRYVEYCRRPKDLSLLPGAGEAIKRLNHRGLAVIVVTNQSAIGRGWLTVRMLEAIHQKMRRELRRAGARIDQIYFCPHRPEDGCGCRKPASGMFERAAQELRLELRESYMIGDRALDVASGMAIGARTILVRTGHPPEPGQQARPDFEAATLAEAVEWIMARERELDSVAAGTVAGAP